jgi:site-specific recombinase XerD
MKKIVDRSYEQDEFFKKWLVGLSERTKENYSKEFHNWYIFINMTPTEQIKRRMHDLTTEDINERTFFENKFREYKEFLEKQGKLSALSIKTMLRTVASFFGRNSLPLNLKRGDWESTLETSVIQRWKITKEDVKAMYGHANLRDRSLLLILAQSGLSEVDCSELKIEDIKGLYEMPQTEHYVIEKPREKTGQIQATCLSYEFLHDLRAMLSEIGNPTEGPIFVSQTKDKGSRIETRRINEAMKALAAKSFGTERAKQFKTKALRSFYNSALLRADIKNEVKDLMMGHARLGARGHYDYDAETIKESYLRAFEHLSINGIQSREDLAKLREDMNQTIGRQQRQIEELTQKLNTFMSLLAKAGLEKEES